MMSHINLFKENYYTISLSVIFFSYKNKCRQLQKYIFTVQMKELSASFYFMMISGKSLI